VLLMGVPGLGLYLLRRIGAPEFGAGAAAVLLAHVALWLGAALSADVEAEDGSRRGLLQALGSLASIAPFALAHLTLYLVVTLLLAGAFSDDLDAVAGLLGPDDAPLGMAMLLVYSISDIGSSVVLWLALSLAFAPALTQTVGTGPRLSFLLSVAATRINPKPLGPVWLVGLLLATVPFGGLAAPWFMGVSRCAFRDIFLGGRREVRKPATSPAAVRAFG
jgi:hypothetical protein